MVTALVVASGIYLGFGLCVAAFFAVGDRAAGQSFNVVGFALLAALGPACLAVIAVDGVWRGLRARLRRSSRSSRSVDHHPV